MNTKQNNEKPAQYPTIETERLILRAFNLTDAPEVQRLAGDREIASMTLSIPHPYEDGVAEKWISTHRDLFEKGQVLNLAITRRDDGGLVGSIGITINTEHENAELGYWIGKQYWNQGYCTEAARPLLKYAFETLKLNRIEAHHFARNPASGRIMKKIGLLKEGCLRQHIIKWDAFEDIVMYGILKTDYEKPI
ncbi:MAG: GNAT family N-acetyltransferase [Planctomycetota bacterium]|jgi:RimJ/RimL family protein N-acetyltransferase